MKKKDRKNIRSEKKKKKKREVPIPSPSGVESEEVQ